MKPTPDRWLLIVLAIAVAVLVYLGFADKPQVEYRTPTSSSRIAVPQDTQRRNGFESWKEWQEQEEKRRLEARINCLARQARDTQRDRRYEINITC